MNRLIDAHDLVRASNLNRFGGEITAKLLMQIFKLNRINKIYSHNFDKKGIQFVNSVLEQLHLKYYYLEEELNRIPKSGSFITISNHPYGGIEGLILLKLVTQIRPDYKLMANFLLQKVKPIEELFLPVNPFENFKEFKSSYAGLKTGIEYIKTGGCLGLFPAGEVSSYVRDFNKVTDREWSISALKFIRNVNAQVIPIYFSGNNSALFQLLARIHPNLRTIKLPSELFNKKKHVIHIRIGNPISVKDQNELDEIHRYGRFLRLKTYSLGGSADVKRSFFKPRFELKKQERIPDAVQVAKIKEELDSIRPKHLLCFAKEYEVFCSNYQEISNISREIARLREITYREIGEGTNKALDIDEYDLYYDQMFIWDKDNEKIVGAYRMGKGEDIYSQYGIKGFYIRSLFKISKEMIPVLTKSIELGRSFIIKEYQTKPLSLYLLWKGILHYLVNNPEYRYLIGTVSISNNYSAFSKELIIEFIKANFYAKDYAGFVEPRKAYKIKLNKDLDKNIILKIARKDLNKLDRFIQDIEPNYKMPVLLKKYLQQNAKIIAFNVDPKFNNCLDGLMIQDLEDIPFSILQFMLKGDIDTKAIYKRFKEW